MARKIRVSTKATGGIEMTLKDFGGLLLAVGIVASIICFVMVGYAVKASSSSAPIYLGIGIIVLICSIACRYLFSAGAEIIKLLKKLNGLAYGGEISQAVESYSYKCSDCNNEVLADTRSYIDERSLPQAKCNVPR